MNDLETAVIQTIGESTSAPDVFVDTASGMAPIRDSINAAIQELCAVTGTYVRQYHLPLYANRFFYRMGWGMDHFGYVIECWNRRKKQCLLQTDVLSLSLRDPWFLQRTGDPERYMQIGHNILGFDRAPSASGDTLEITCAAIPLAYTTDKDPVKLRPAFQRAATQYAVSEYFASRGDVPRAKEWLDKYLETAEIMGLHPQQAERIFEQGKGQPWERTTVR